MQNTKKKNKAGQKANFICDQKFKTTFFSRTWQLTLQNRIIFKEDRSFPTERRAKKKITPKLSRNASIPCRTRHYVESMQMLCHQAMQNLC